MSMISQRPNQRLLHGAHKYEPSLSISTMNPNVLKAEYAVRGEIAIRADELKKKMASGEKLPFDSIIPCNIGNPFAVGKTPMKFPRQVLSCVENPELLNSKDIPEEAKERAKEFASWFPAGLGAYTHSQGIEQVRGHIAEFIRKRDGIPADPDKIFLTTGASAVVSYLLEMIISHPKVGILTPYPTYPLYTAEIALKNGKCIPYYLKEADRWSVEISDLEETYTVAQKAGIEVKAIVIINPGNPTGAVLSAPKMREIVDFCEQRNILIIADEVYQDNIYTEKPFVSFKKIVSDMKSSVQLVSMHSLSKGFMGECGHRAGYMELIHIDDKVKQQLYKLASISLCPNSVGQLLMDCYAHPPESKECREEWDNRSKNEIEKLKEKALRLEKCINGLPGMSCQPAEGAMYLFPSIHMPLKVFAEAKKFGQARGNIVEPDMFWSLKLLEETGIVVVPGSGFGQVPGTYHFRTTFLPEAGRMDQMIERLTAFQNKFMEQYS